MIVTMMALVFVVGFIERLFEVSDQAPLGMAIQRGLRRWAFWFTGTSFH